MAQTPQRTRLQDFIVTQTGDAIRGEDAATGADVQVRGGHSSGDGSPGGDINMAGGNPGTGVAGIGGAGGDILMTGIAGATGGAGFAGGAGGVLSFTAGAGGTGGVGNTAGGAAGVIALQAGAGGAGVGLGLGATGGNINLLSGPGGTGAASTKGGNILLQTAAGPGALHDGGDIVLSPAPAVGFGVAGIVDINGNAELDGGLMVNGYLAVPYSPIGQPKGTYWVLRGTPTLPYFTDSAGTDHNLLGGAGAGTYDSYLDQGAGGDADPIFTDMPAIAAKIAGLPTTSIPYPVTNTLHFLPGTNLSLVTPGPGPYSLINTEIRGTAPVGPFGTVAYDAALVIVSNIGAPGATFEDVRTFKDVCFQHASTAVAPTFLFTSSPYCEFDNVSVSVPFNSSPTVGVWYQTFPGEFERLRINKTVLNTTSFELDGGTLDVLVETDNVIAPDAFIGTGTVNLFLRGTGNYVSTLQSPTLDIEIGDGSIGFPPMKTSGAETITFGAGTHTWNWSAGPVPPGTTGYQLCPGGGMLVGDPPPPDPGGGGTQLQAGRTVAGIVRGIHVQIGANVSNATFDVWILEGGALKYQETGFTLAGCVGAGTYLSTTFAQLTGTFPLAVWIIPAALSQGDWDHINVSFFVR